MVKFSAPKMPSPEGMINVLNFLYDKATGDLPILGSAQDLANSYRNKGGTPHENVDSLIRWQCTKTASSGFLLGLPGGAAIIATLPADMTQTLFLQLRMVAAIGHIYEHDPSSDAVRSLAFACLCGAKAMDIMKQAGIQVGQRTTTILIKKIPGAVLTKINKIVGMRLVTKFGSKGVINLGKAVPLVGGLIGGGMNGFGTYAIGKTAKKVFGTQEV